MLIGCKYFKIVLFLINLFDFNNLFKLVSMFSLWLSIFKYSFYFNSINSK